MSKKSCTGLALGSGRSACAERNEQFAAGIFVERVEVHRSFTLVAEQLDERGSTLFLGRLQLFLGDPQQVHLEGLGEEILGIPAIRTRQGQIFDSVSGRLRPSPARVYPNPCVQSPGFVIQSTRKSSPYDLEISHQSSPG
jgi:hypothetical protein